THQLGHTLTQNGSLAIGGEQDGVNASYAASQAYDGEMAEVIMYNTFLNNAQRTIVENYLSTKYGISISNDKYAYDATYGNDLAGIGREDASNTHISASSSILNINVGSLSTNGQYLLFGHNNANATSLTNISGDDFRGDATNTRRIAREWRVDKTGGDLGNVNVAFDITGLTLPSSDWTLAILIDSNGDGDFVDTGDSYADLSVAGSTASASNVTVPDGATVTLGALRRTVSFATVSSQGFENTVQYPTLTASLNYAYTNSTTVNFSYTVAAGTAQAGDFTTSSTSATISAGSSSVNFNASTTALVIINDSGQESTETVNITLTGTPTNAVLGSITSHTYSILDDDEPRKISFTSATLSQAEGNSGNYTLSINLDLTSTDAGLTFTDVNSTVDVAITGGTATVGTDGSVTTSNSPPASGSAGIQSATSATGTIRFNQVSCPNGSTNTVGIGILTINGDNLFEANETLELTLSNTQSCALNASGNIIMTVTLTNDESTPTVQFSAANSSSSEDGGTVNVSVSLSEATGTDVTVNFSDVGGTPAATNGSDYTVSSSPLTIPAGSTSANIQVSLINDGTEEYSEQLVLTITGSSVSLGAQTTHSLTILDNDSMGDTGPGGVGNSSSNLFWLKADAITGVSNGQAVTSWSDQSGNGNSFTANSSYAPVLSSGAINGLNSILFSSSTGGTGSRLVRNPFNISTTAIGVYMVLKDPNTDNNNSVVSYAVSADNNEYLIFNAGSVTTYINSQTDNSGYAINDNNWKVLSHGWRSSDGMLRIHVNGTMRRNSTLQSGQPIATGGSLAIGGEQDAVDGAYDAAQAYDGEMAEVIMFNQMLNDARRTIVENYLSAKYNISISNDYYAGDTPANGDYDLYVAGIGTTDATLANSHTSTANSQGLILQERNGSLNAANEFLFCGHNSATNAITNQNLTIVGRRWTRSWYIDKTGAIDATLTFDFSDAGVGGTPGNPINYVLLYRGTISANFSPLTTGATSVSGDQVSFNLINTQLSDGYYTLGTIDEADSPLPVELTGFDLSYDGKGVKLKWTTATETNNLGFIVSRSETKDGEYKQIASYQSHQSLKGQGTTATATNYNMGDYSSALQPGKTYFYKLEDVNLVGQRNVLEIKEIKLPEAYSLSQNYPNPFNPMTTIQFSLKLDGKTVLEVYNLLGQKVATLINEDLKAGAHSYKWNATGQASGLYFYRLRSGSFISTKKMVLTK
ncbi:MAG: T9SS type A sorting domain-containing protein, partial [Geobacteraceae bacterium]|nr:T9SS type A sorting domain-containing protein [Geobacteraceae bacterium]